MGKSQITCSLKIFLAEVGEDNKTQLVVRHTLITCIIEGATTMNTSLTTKVSKNMRIFTEICTKGYYYICIVAVIPALKPSIIFDMVKCS